jgi:hypothetical protein
LLRGDVAIFADQPGTLRANDLQAVGIMAERRVPEFPDTPTFREQGVDLVFSIWSGIFAPAGVPEATLARMEAACERALRAPPSSRASRGWRRRSSTGTAPLSPPSGRASSKASAASCRRRVCGRGIERAAQCRDIGRVQSRTRRPQFFYTTAPLPCPYLAGGRSGRS